MDNQHRKITGYRELSQAEIDLINEIKAEGVRLQALSVRVQEHILLQRAQFPAGSEEADAVNVRHNIAEPDKWASWAKDGFQTNLMYLTRAVAQPTSF